MIRYATWQFAPFRLPLILSLSGHEYNYDDVRCAEFGLWQGARREHPPKWGCDRRATQPQAKFGATLRAAVLFWPDFVARSLRSTAGYARRSRLPVRKPAQRPETGPGGSRYFCEHDRAVRFFA